ATDGCCLGQGAPTTLTYSFVPDGTPISGGAGEPSSPSDMRAFLDGIYGSSDVWMPLFHAVFARWSELAGVRYVYEPADDGAPFPTAGGALGVRGDVRIGGHPINGTGGVIAYNWYPNSGDMVLDTADANLGYTAGESLLLRNVVAHEHGHGLGLNHVCPIDETKLMEPIATLSFDGPQHDDVLAGQRGYGDPLESNDAAASATDLGTLSSNTTVGIDGMSADDDADVDFYRFAVGGGKKLSATLTPVGFTYLQGPQNPDGSCTSGTPFDSRTRNDLALDVLAADGSTVVASASGAPAGTAEAIDDLALPTAGAYFLRIRPGPASTVQLYDLSLSVADVAAKPEMIFEDDFEAGDLAAWSAVRDAGGQLVVSASAALEGDLGLEVLPGHTATSQLIDRHPDAEEHYRVRFLLDASGYVSPSETSRPHLLRVFAGATELQARVRRDDKSSYNTAWFPISAAAHEIALEWQKGTSTGANDGTFQLWIDGGSVASVTSLDNDLQLVKYARFGFLGGSAAAGGVIRLDGYTTTR